MTRKRITPYKTVEDVEKGIREGVLQILPILKKDTKSRRALEYYDLFHLVYDENQVSVPDFYFCKKCGILFNIDLHAGSHEMRRHTCIKVMMARNEARKTDERKIFVFPKQGGEKKVGDLINTFSVLCAKHGSLDPSLLAKIASPSWTMKEWYVNQL